MHFPSARLLGVAVMTVILGCSPKSEDSGGGSGDGPTGDDGGGDDGGDDGTGDDGTGDDGTGDDGGGDDDSPVVTADDAFCSVHVSGDTRAVWTVLATASDPQGADTLEVLVSDGVVVSHDGSEAARHPLSCVVVDLSRADCTGTFAALGDGTSCDDASAHSIVVEVVDEDGNRGVSAAITGRQE